jgi:DNA-binding MarR family transcriptional regulator
LAGTGTQVERETVERLRSALGITARYLRSTDAGAGLTPTELSILATITRRGSLRLTELAEIERVNPTMLSRIAARLAEAQLISRQADREDRRAARVEATRAGKALHERIRAERTASLGAHLDELSDDDVAALLAALPALEALAEGLRRDAPGPSPGART